MTPSELASKIDHTLLKPEATLESVDRLIDEAVEYKFCSVCISPIYVAHAAKRLRGTGVLVCTVCGFPSGTSKSIHKAIEATGLVKDGADEIDVVGSLPDLARGDVNAVRASLLELVRAVRAARRDVAVKVIVESAYLMSLGSDQGEAAIAAACTAIREGGCDFIKSSTGFHPLGGATIDAVRLMKSHGNGIKIKAAGGLRDPASAQAMLAAGADRLGMSASVSVVNEFKQGTAGAGSGAGY